jgi:hypothetical protein
LQYRSFYLLDYTLGNIFIVVLLSDELLMTR